MYSDSDTDTLCFDDLQSNVAISGAVKFSIDAFSFDVG